MIMIYPDVQQWKPAQRFPLTRAGTSRLKKVVRIHRPDKEVTLIPSITLGVDLPATQKGSHMSRNVEVINEVVREAGERGIDSLESLCAAAARRLLERHEYARSAGVEMEADYFQEREVGGTLNEEHYTLIAEAEATREENGEKGGRDSENGDSENEITVRKLVGVKVTGMTACPCAMETTRSILMDSTGKNGNPAILDFPTMTHNQRNVSTILLEVAEEEPVEANDLIRIVEESMSSPTFGILKRRYEGELVKKAHENPKFVEDVVREILTRVVKHYSGLPDSAAITVRSVSEESIHKHDAYAECQTTMGKLREYATE